MAMTVFRRACDSKGLISEDEATCQEEERLTAKGKLSVNRKTTNVTKSQFYVKIIFRF